MVVGYQWYIKDGYGLYVPNETIFASLTSVKENIKNYLLDSKIPRTACGIDKVIDDDGCITVLEKIETPIETYYEIEEEET